MTTDQIKAALAGAAGKRGRRVLFADKRPGLVYLTPQTWARLATLARNAQVNRSDFLEILISRHGIQAGSDILAARGDDA